MTRTLAALGLGIVLHLCGCTVWIEFYTAGEGGSGGAGGSGGSGGNSGSSMLCTPGETRECYSGPAGTKGVGVCKVGVETCAPDGSAFGACEGQGSPVPENCATPEDDDCDPDTTCDVLWARRFGDESLQIGTSVAVDGSGNIIAAGDFTGSMDLGPNVLVSSGSRDVFVVKLDPAGAPLWGSGFGDAGYQSATSIAVDANGNTVVVGQFQGSMDFGNGVALASTNGADGFVASVDPTGVTLWSRRLGGFGDQYASSVAVDSQGSIVVVGHFFGAIELTGEPMASTDGTDLFAAKLAADGSPLWFKTFGGSGDQESPYVAIDDKDDVILTCAGAGDMELGGGQLLVSAGNYDIFLAKLGTDGSPIWSRRYGDVDSQAPKDVAIDDSGNILLVGWFGGTLTFDDSTPLTSAGSTDIFVAKLAPDGSAVWSRRYGDDTVAEQVGAAVAAKGTEVFVTGFFGGTLDFGDGQSVTNAEDLAGYDAFVAKLGGDGSGLWAGSYGDEASQRGLDVATGDDGSVLVTGLFSGSLNFQSQKLTSAGDADIFVAKLKP